MARPKKVLCFPSFVSLIFVASGCVFPLFCVDIQTEEERLFATEREKERERESRESLSRSDNKRSLKCVCDLHFTGEKFFSIQSRRKVLSSSSPCLR